MGSSLLLLAIVSAFVAVQPELFISRDNYQWLGRLSIVLKIILFGLVIPLGFFFYWRWLRKHREYSKSQKWLIQTILVVGVLVMILFSCANAFELSREVSLVKIETICGITNSSRRQTRTRGIGTTFHLVLENDKRIATSYAAYEYFSNYYGFDGVSCQPITEELYYVSPGNWLIWP